MKNIILEELTENYKEQFIEDNQRSFKYGAMEEFGLRDDHMEEDGEIISKETIEQSINNGKAYRILFNDEYVGGVIICICDNVGDLEILFINPEVHSKGLGYATWCTIEKMFPEVEIWETCTPYFEKRNIHFYVNKCGFQIVEFYNEFHKEPNSEEYDSNEGPDEMFLFRKVMKKC